MNKKLKEKMYINNINLYNSRAKDEEKCQVHIAHNRLPARNDMAQ